MRTEVEKLQDGREIRTVFNDENIRIEEKEFNKQGQADGFARGFFDGDKIHWEMNFRNGEKHGPAILYYEDGNVAGEENYRHDQLHGDVFLYDKDGNITYQGTYINGVIAE